MIEIDFDDDDRSKPSLPFLVMHPTVAQKAMEEEKNLTEEEKKDFEEKQQKILDAKYKDYMEREDKRKLID